MLLAQRCFTVGFAEARGDDIRDFANALADDEYLGLEEALARAKLALQVVAGRPKDHLGIEAKDHYLWLYRSFRLPTKRFPKVTGYRWVLHLYHAVSLQARIPLLAFDTPAT
nr:hypothetical protein Hi04_10k_c962_00040 [uncultured bacterium]